MSFIRTGFRELGLKVRRQKTRMALRHEKRNLQKTEIALGREGVTQAVNFPELRTEIVALKKLEQEQKEVALRIAHVEESLKQIETQRQQNAKEQSEALASLETEKKPMVQLRDEAKTAADLCDRELAGVDRRLQENDTADRELLEALAVLQQETPPPADFDQRSSALSSKRVHLPEQRNEIARARAGSAEACRTAKEKLEQQQKRLDEIDKRMSAVRADFEERDRVLNENSRSQQDVLKEARTHHQTVEERKNPAYLNIGRHLATQGIAPPNAPELLQDVTHRRTAVEKHSQHKAELAVLSSQIDKQELRKFYFSGFSIFVLLVIILPLVFQSPAKREWLPSETEAILSVNMQKMQHDEMPKRWDKDQPEEWKGVWSGLVGNAKLTPGLNLSRDAYRVTRAMTTAGPGGVREFILVQAKDDVTPVIRAVEQKSEFERQPVDGLAVWRRPGFAMARVGPQTLAVGSQPEVEKLVQVRLGIKQDLKITGPLFNRFLALDKDSALRLVSSDPPSFARLFNPIFTHELLDGAQILALGLALENPVKGRLLLRMKSGKEAEQRAQQMRSEPQQWLRLQDSDALLYVQSPEVTVQDADIEVRFDVPENSARLLLQRIAKTNAPPAIAGP
ncbi:MAG: hypothetical protein ABI992_00255 [Chthoniobacterales bacterium]